MKTVFAIAGILIAMSVVGHMDYEDQVAAEKAECLRAQQHPEQMRGRHMPRECKELLEQ